MKIHEIALLAVGIVIIGCTLVGCRGKQYSTMMTANTSDSGNKESEEIPENLNDQGMVVGPAQYVPGELICSVDTQEEADNIASLYNIELRDFSHGVAIYFAGEDADIFAIIEEGEKNGYPILSPNYIFTLDSDMSLE